MKTNPSGHLFRRLSDQARVIYGSLITLAVFSVLVLQFACSGLPALNRNLSGLELLHSLEKSTTVDDRDINVFSSDTCQKFWLLGLGEQSTHKKETYWQTALRCSQQYLTSIRFQLPDSKILANDSVQQYPYLPQGWFWLASQHNKMNDPATSIRFYERGLNLEPDNGVALYGLAEAFEADGQYAQAIKAYIKSCEYLNQGTDCYVRAGKIMERLGDIKSAILYYRLSIFPDAHTRADELERQLLDMPE